MANPQQRSFNCHSCNGIIYIPYHLPPTTAPCPHCGTPITSPPLPVTPLPVAENPPIVMASEPEIPRVTHPRAEEIAAPTTPEPVAAVATSRSENPRDKSGFYFFTGLIVLLLIVLGGGAWLLIREHQYQKNNQNLVKALDASSAPQTEEDKADLYFKKAWVDDAQVVLQAFLQAQSPEEKAKYVLGGTATLDRLRALYGEKVLSDKYITADCFYPVHNYSESKKSNIFLMTYHRETQIDMTRFFRPLISSEMLHGIEKINPLTESLGNMNQFMMPRLTIQAYFKKTEQGMLLDWDVYAQTRFQDLRKFFETGKEGEQKKFRVILIKDHLSASNVAESDVLKYVVCDPGHNDDRFTVFVKRDSPEAKALQKLDLAEGEIRKTKYETATVLLEYAGEENIHLKKLVTWQFEGLGSESVSNEIPPTKEKTKDEGSDQ